MSNWGELLTYLPEAWKELLVWIFHQLEHSALYLPIPQLKEALRELFDVFDSEQVLLFTSLEMFMNKVIDWETGTTGRLLNIAIVIESTGEAAGMLKAILSPFHIHEKRGEKPAEKLVMK